MSNAPGSGAAWWYRHSPVRSLEDLPNDSEFFGFCYKITNLKTGSFYIGKKQFYTCRRKRVGVREKKASQSRKRFKEVVKESDWKEYWGSNEELSAEVALLGPAFFRREILELAFSSKHLSYLETRYQFVYDVLNVPSYNKNIMGRFFARDVARGPASPPAPLREERGECSVEC